MNKFSFAGLIVFLTWADAGAVGIPVVNHSFETPVVAPGTFNVSAPPTGWFLYGSVNSSGWRSVGVVNPNTTPLYFDPVPLGSNIGVTFLGPTYSNIPTGLFQVLATTLQARTAYTLTVAVGNMASNLFNFTGFPGYRVELLASNFVVAADHNTLLPGEGRFLTSTVFAVTSSSHTNLGLPLGIRLINLDSAPGIEVNFDDVRLDAVPLPDPVVSISGTDLGDVQVEFTEQLQASSDLLIWTNVVPLPGSPWTITPEELMQFYRAIE